MEPHACTSGVSGVLSLWGYMETSSLRPAREGELSWAGGLIPALGLCNVSEPLECSRSPGVHLPAPSRHQQFRR